MSLLHFDQDVECLGGSSTDNAIARFDGTSCDVQDSPNSILLDDGSLTLGIPQTTNGMSKLKLIGPSTSTSGPHFETYKASDAYPLYQNLSWDRDNIALLFDAYFDGTNWKSSDSGSNFRIYKFADVLRFDTKTGVSQGGTITWNTGFHMPSTGGIQLPTVGGTASTLDFYQEQTGTLTFQDANTPWDNTNSPSISYTRIGKTVTLQIATAIFPGPDISSPTILSDAIPAQYRPAELFIYKPIRVSHNGANQVGSVTLDSSGNLRVYADATHTTNWAGLTFGFWAFTLNYHTF